MVFEYHNISDAALNKTIRLFHMETFGEIFTKFRVLFKPECAVHTFVYMAHGRRKIFIQELN